MWMNQSRFYWTQEILGVHDKNQQGKKIEELSEANKVPLEHMFNGRDNCSAEWCFNTRAPEEVKTDNDKEDELRCKQNDKQIYDLLQRLFSHFKQTKF